MHLVLGDVIHPYRQKGPRPHMQGDKAAFHTQGGKSGQERIIKMQAGRGCRHRSGLASVDGLIAFPILGLRSALNVRWQGNRTMGFQECQPVLALAFEPNLHLLFFFYPRPAAIG